MNTLRLFAALATAGVVGACASGGSTTGGDTELTPIVSLRGGGGAGGGIKRKGSFTATNAASSGLLTGNRAARVDGTVTVTPEAGTDDQFTVVIELNSQRGAEELLWSIVPGPCGSADLPLVSPRQNARIDVRDSGLARVTAEFRAMMTNDQAYHVNLYANEGTDQSDVVACSNLRS